MVGRLRAVAPGKPVGIHEVGVQGDVAFRSQWIRYDWSWSRSAGIKMTMWFNTLPPDTGIDYRVLGGTTGDATFTFAGQSYEAYVAHREGVAATTVTGPDRTSPRLLTDDQFLGR